MNNLFTAPSACNSCIIYTSTDVPRAITDLTTTTSIISVPSGGTIEDVQIENLIGTHSWLGDLEFNLMSPQGTVVRLIDRQCDGDDNFNLNLSDTSSTNIVCPYNNGQWSKPDSVLSKYDGENPSGIWTLTISDAANLDEGELTNWSLKVCHAIVLEPCNVTDGQVNGSIASGTYRSPDQILSDGSVATGNVMFYAKDSVVLKANFSVTQGALFEAQIKDCKPNP